MEDKTLFSYLDKLDVKKKSVRYCYLVKTTEIGDAAVYSAYKEAVEEAERLIQQQGVDTWETNVINDSLTVLEPSEYRTYEQAQIVRFIVR